MLEGVASMAGNRSICQLLSGLLQAFVTKARDLPGWLPVVSVDEALQ
jgi:hypothetical protein